MVVAEFGVGQALLTMIWFFLIFIWIMLVFRVFADIFRSHDLSGVAKVAWILFIIIFVYLGVFVYLIARGQKMAEHEVASAKAQDQAMRDYVRSASGGGSASDELARIADLKEKGVIDDAEFAKMKAKIIG